MSAVTGVCIPARELDALRAELAAAKEALRWRKNMVNDPKYAKLAEVLTRAYEQAANGKGKERHATDLPFHEQPIMQIQALVGNAFALGQAVKKVQESTRLPPERAVAELLGAINYLAAAVIRLERGLDEKDVRC